MKKRNSLEQLLESKLQARVDEIIAENNINQVVETAILNGEDWVVVGKDISDSMGLITIYLGEEDIPAGTQLQISINAVQHLQKIIKVQYNG